MYPPVYTAYFPLLSKGVIISVILGAMKVLSLSLFYNAFMYWNRSPVGETLSPERIIYCWSLRILLLKSSNCSPLLKSRVARSDWTSPFILPKWGAHECFLSTMSVFPSLKTVLVVVTNAFSVSSKYQLVFLTFSFGLSDFFGNRSLILEDIISLLDILQPVNSRISSIF